MSKNSTARLGRSVRSIRHASMSLRNLAAKGIASKNTIHSAPSRASALHKLAAIATSDQEFPNRDTEIPEGWLAVPMGEFT